MITQNYNKVNEKQLEFSKHKKFALSLQNMLANLYDSQQPTQKGSGIRNCGSSLIFEKFRNEDETTKLAGANFCKHRLCPFCAWRWHKKTSTIIDKAFQILGERNYYHIVLTIPNVRYLTKEFLIDLRVRATTMLKKVIKCKDYIISFEITIDKEGNFHPHFHCLCILDNVPTKKFLQTEWAKVSACGNNYAICDIKKCTDNKISQELTKYILKFEDDTIDTQKLKVINFAIKGLRKFATNGIIKEAEAKAKDEIAHERFENLKELSKYDSELYFYKWLGQSYSLQDIIQVDKDERGVRNYDD